MLSGLRRSCSVSNLKMSKSPLADLEQGASLLPKPPQQPLALPTWARPCRSCLALWLLGLVCLWYALPGLTCFAQAAYGVAWWILRSPVQWAQPLPQGAGVDDQRNLTVPKILHQTWKSREVPEKWRAAQQSCLDLHKDYEYRLWTDEDAQDFIEEHYPWFLPTYLAYPYQIQRADVIRYFILYHFGGVYMDLDMGCRKRLDFMRQYNFTAPLTHPGGISNDVLAAAPGDAYLARALGQLRRWNRPMLLKYIQVMFSTGPMFLTTQYSLYRGKAGVAVIPPVLYGKYDKSGDPYFYHLHGSSWHENDAAFVFWLDRHKTLLIVVGIATAATLACGYWLRCLARIRKTRTF